MRGATAVAAVFNAFPVISIHAPHAGRDMFSTRLSNRQAYFNPRAPCGARLVIGVPIAALGVISIHAPHAGRDPVQMGRYPLETISIHAPHAGRDYFWYLLKPFNRISIHAPHAGRDLETVRAWICTHYFNPRAPCGARLSFHVNSFLTGVFQSTRPMRGATAKVYKIALHTFATKGNS